MTKPQSFWAGFKKQRAALLGGSWIVLLSIVALAGPLLRPDPTPHANDQNLSWALLPPGAEVDDPASEGHKVFVLGTDRFGRDFLSRLMAGSGISLGVGAMAVLISLLIGVPLGAYAGYRGGWPDAIIRWVIQVVWTLPTLLMVLAIALAFGKGLVQIFIAIGLTMWVDVARVVRGVVLSLKEEPYIEAARALGLRSPSILTRHILPGAIGPILVLSASNFATAILVEAGLSFLGVGAQMPAPSWGNIVQAHCHLITGDHAHLALAPGLLIVSVVLAFTFLGDGLRTVLDAN